MRNTLFKFIISAAALFCITACNMGPKPNDVAEEFLNSYFAADYEAAAELCTSELGNDLLAALKEMQALNESIRENIKKHTKYYKPQVIQSEQPQNRDSVVINYIVVNVVADTLNASNAIESSEKIKESRIHLVRTDDGWRVSALK